MTVFASEILNSVKNLLPAHLHDIICPKYTRPKTRPNTRPNTRPTINIVTNEEV